MRPTRNYLEQQLGPRTFQLTVSPGPLAIFHGGQWLPLDGTLQGSGGIWRPGRTAYGLEIANDGSRMFYPDADDLSRYLSIPRLPFLPNPRSVSGDSITWENARYRVTFRAEVARVKMDVLFKQRPPFDSITIPITARSMSFTDILAQAVAVDATGLERVMPMTIGPNSVRIDLDFTGMVFPVQLDPTINPQPAASADDVRIRTNTWSATQENFSAGNDGTGIRLSSAARFVLTGPASGATVNACTFTWRANANRSTSGVNTNIYCEDADDAAQIVSTVEFDGRSKTAGTAYDSIAAETTGTDYTSPDFSADMQTVLGRAGWASGQHCNMFLENDASTTSSHRSAYSYDGDSTNCEKLNLTYTNPSAGGGPVFRILNVR